MSRVTEVCVMAEMHIPDENVSNERYTLSKWSFVMVAKKGEGVFVCQ